MVAFLLIILTFYIGCALLEKAGTLFQAFGKDLKRRRSLEELYRKESLRRVELSMCLSLDNQPLSSRLRLASEDLNGRRELRRLIFQELEVE